MGDCRRGLLGLRLPPGRDCLHDQPNFVLPCRLGQDCSVPQHTVVQSILRLLGFLSIAVLDESNAMGQVEAEVHEWAVLLAQGLQG